MYSRVQYHNPFRNHYRNQLLLHQASSRRLFCGPFGRPCDICVGMLMYLFAQSRQTSYISWLRLFLELFVGKRTAKRTSTAKP